MPHARIAHLLVPGINRVKVQTTTQSDASGGMLDVRVHRGEDELAQRIWNSAPEDPVPPAEFELEFSQDTEAPTWMWVDSMVVSPPYPDQPGMLSLVRAVHSAFVQRDIDALMELLAHKNRELALAFTTDIDRANRSQRAFFGDLFANEPWNVEALDTDNMPYFSQGNGRLIEPTSPDGEPVIRVTFGEDRLNYSLRLMYIYSNGKWLISR